MMKRRQFLQGCCAGIIAMNGVRLEALEMGEFSNQPGSKQPILVNLFLRGGMDALSFLPPHGVQEYHDARSKLSLDTKHVHDIDGRFGLHPAAEKLMEVYQQGQLGIVAASGLPYVNRSHFDAQEVMERGAEKATSLPHSGWVGRYLSTLAEQSMFRGVSFRNGVAPSQYGFEDALAMERFDSFSLRGDWSQQSDMRRAIRKMYMADAQYNTVAAKTMNTIDLFAANDTKNYRPSNGAKYPNKKLGNMFKSLAQLIRLDVGLRAASIDMGGWDTHRNQAYGNDPTKGSFNNLASDLCNTLHAFWLDMSDFHDNITIVVMSEFGRRLRENNNIGTDHGHAGIMMVLNKNFQEKKIWGEWPGLATDQLTQRADLRVTTDYRLVLSEILKTQFSFDQAEQIFPKFKLETSSLSMFKA